MPKKVLKKTKKSNRSTKNKILFKKITNHRAKLLVFVILFAIVGAYILFRSFAYVPNATQKMGVYRGAGKPENTAEYEKWLGRDVKYALEFLGVMPNDSSEPWAVIENPGWFCGRWASTKYSPVFSVAMLPTNKQTLAAGARGEYNAHWKKFAEVMVARGCGDDVLRIGWEFNGAFYNWSIADEADGINGNQSEAELAKNYAEYWRQIVRTVRSVPGTNFKFDWCPLRGKLKSNQKMVELAYPSGKDAQGREYVDYIGLDNYDTARIKGAPQERWNEQLNEELGMVWHKNFAISKNKPISFPEWGITVRPNDSLGGGDNPYYIQKMYDWMNSLPASGGGSLAYHSYFEYDARDGNHRLMLGQFPLSADRFKKLFGVLPAETTPPPTTSDPAPTPTPDPDPMPSVTTVVFEGKQSKYSSDSHYVRIPSSGEVKFDLTSPQNARYDIIVYDPSGKGIKVYEKIDVNTPLSGSFTAKISGNYRFFIKTKYWSDTSYKLVITHPK